MAASSRPLKPLTDESLETYLECNAGNGGRVLLLPGPDPFTANRARVLPLETGRGVCSSLRRLRFRVGLATASTNVLNEKRSFVQRVIDSIRDERGMPHLAAPPGQRVRDSIRQAGGTFRHSAFGLPSVSAFCRARLAVAQPSLVTCRDLPTASAPAGTSRVMHDPAPT